MASQITRPTIVYSTIYPAADQRKHQSSAWLAFVRGIHRWPVNFSHKGPVTRKMFPFDDVIMLWHGTGWFPSGSPHWYSGDHKIVHVPVKQYWWIWANIYESRGSNMNRLYNHSYKHNGTVRIFIINPFTWTGDKISSFHKWRHMIFMASHNRNISIDFSTAKSGRLRGNIKVPH